MLSQCEALGLETSLPTSDGLACRHAKLLQLCLTLCDPMDCIAHQAALSTWFSREEYWSGLPCPPPGDLPTPGTEPMTLTSPALAGGFFTTSASWEAQGLADQNPLKISGNEVTSRTTIHCLPTVTLRCYRTNSIFPTLQNNYLLLQIFRSIRGKISISYMSSACLPQGNILPHTGWLLHDFFKGVHST